MRPVKVKTSSEQIADYLRKEILDRTWTKTLPGEAKLASELAIGHGTIKAALAQLEREGLLKSQGAGRRRQIVSKQVPVKKLQVRILLYEPNDGGFDFMINLRHQLELAGHSVRYAAKTQVELSQSKKRIAALVKADQADAWIVQSGSKSVLEWFHKSGIPVFALFGRMRDLPIAGAGPDKATAMCELANWLVDLGHQRIAMLVRKERRYPKLGTSEQSFLDELSRRGIAVGTYNIPDWEDNPKGFRDCLESLFQVTPPTALFLDTSLLSLLMAVFC